MAFGGDISSCKGNEDIAKCGDRIYYSVTVFSRNNWHMKTETA